MTKIIAAAIRWKGVAFTGDRHGHIIKYLVQIGQLQEHEGIKDKVTDDMQGFIDEQGVFWSRDASRVIAIHAGQVPPEHGVLYSEDLW